MGVNMWALVLHTKTHDDAELWTDVQPQASRRLLLAALEAFAAVGYHATTTREIARRAGMSPAAVYFHYRTKTDLLEAIARTGHEAVLHEVERALDGVEGPTERLRAFVLAFAGWHVRHHTLARVTQYELQSLPPEPFAEIGKLRKRFEKIVQTELRRGNDTGEFDVPDIKRTALAILSLGIDIARWYTPRHRSAPEELAAFYADLTLRMVQPTKENE